MKEYDDLSPEFPWEWTCANPSCMNYPKEETGIIGLTLEEFKPGKEQILLNAVFCSEKCLETVLSAGIRFKEKLENYHMEEKPRPRKFPVRQEEEIFCAYCGKFFKEKHYFLSLLAFGRIDSEDRYAFVNAFCSNDCYNKALNLGPKYYEYAKSVGAFTPENCILKQLEKGAKPSRQMIGLS